MMLCLLLMMTVSGCSGAVISDESRFGQTEITEAGNAAMGRYMEEKSKVEGQFCAPRAFARLTDGRLMILDNISCSLVSEDGGVTWHTKKVEGFDNLTRDMYFMDMKAAPDGTIAILTSPYPEDTFHPEVLLFSPEGEKISIDVTVEEADNYMRTLWFAPDGRLFGIAGGDGIYEINVEEGSCRLYLNVKALSYPEALYIQGKYMIIKSNFGGLYIYDMEAEEYLDDEVLWNFMEKYYAGTEEYLILPEEEGSLYIAGKEGLHRHVIGGSAMEQVIDGSLSSFGDSSVDMINIQPSGEDGFVVLLSSGELCTYTYHPEIPTVPARTLRAYSLEENSALRQAIVVFQRENPDVYVEYEIGMDGKGAATRDDAIKKLNTEIMSGGGPDLVVLDGMPMDSYLEKGMLLDISPYLANMWDGTLFPNVVESFTVDDKIYMIPVTIAVPVLGAKEEYLKDIFNLSNLAERIEKLRREHPGEEIMELISEEVALHRFMAVSEPFWLSKDGSIDRELLADYLMQTKRIYDASLESLPEEAVERNASFEKTRIEVGATDYLSIRTLAPWYANGKLLVASGNLYDVGSFACLCSVKGERGMDDFTLMLMPGYGDGVFQPVTLTGISAAASQPELAAGLLNTLLGREVQSVLYNEGFPVNESAMAAQFKTVGGYLTSNEIEYKEPGDRCTTMATSWISVNGISETAIMEVYIPYQTQQEELMAMLSSVNTPYIPNAVLEEAVYRAGNAYFHGVIDIEEAVSEIEKAVKIHMAE